MKALKENFVKNMNDPLAHEQLADFIREELVEKLIKLSTAEGNTFLI